MPTASASTQPPSNPTAPTVAGGTWRDLLTAPAEQANAEHFDESCKCYRGGQRETGTGKRQHQPARQIRQMESLEDGLEHKPFAHEASLRRHRGQTHRGKQGAYPEHPGGALGQQRMPDQIAVRRDEDTVGGKKQAALRQRMSGEVQQGDGPGEPGQVGQMTLAKQDRSAQRSDGDGRVFGGGEAEQAAPVLLLEGIQHRQNGTEHADHHDEDPKSVGATHPRTRKPAQQAVAEAEEGGVQDNA